MENSFKIETEKLNEILEKEFGFRYLFTRSEWIEPGTKHTWKALTYFEIVDKEKFLLFKLKHSV